MVTSLFLIASFYQFILLSFYYYLILLHLRVMQKALQLLFLSDLRVTQKNLQFSFFFFFFAFSSNTKSFAIVLVIFFSFSLLLLFRKCTGKSCFVIVLSFVTQDRGCFTGPTDICFCQCFLYRKISYTQA